MKTSSNLPDLQMIPTDSLVPHEDCDSRRIDRLCERIRQDGLLKNPPIVVPLPDSDRFVVLDGATRTTAFAQLGVPHIVAQVVSYADPGVDLHTWCHIVSGMVPNTLEADINKSYHLKLEKSNPAHARESLAAQRSIAYFVTEAEVYEIHPRKRGKTRDLHLLTEIVNVYKNRADIYRASNDSWETQAPLYPDINALMVFPKVEPSDILQAVRDGIKLPAGITRHVVQNRALHIKIPLTVLEAEWSLEHKKAWLRQWLEDRILTNGIRYYSEATYFFDE